MIDRYPLVTHDPVRRPIMHQSWLNLAYLHWRVPTDQVAERLPVGLRPDTFDGSAWVGLVPFHMRRIRLPGLPPIPYVGSFPETNVRTYVVGPDGRPGVWFDSLDINRLLPVAVARGSYRLPYMWSRMTIAEEGAKVEYRTDRRWPNQVSSRVVIDRGAQIAADELDRFLTARWGLYTRLG